MKKDLLKEVESYIYKIFKEKSSGKYTYHDFTHTASVVETAEKIGKKENLTEDELEIVKIAAWFHDIGYFIDPGHHEAESIKIAKIYLQKINYPPEKIEQVSTCILATKISHVPKNKLEEVLSDADLHHLGSKDFNDRNELYRIEREKTSGKSISEYEWLQNNIEFLTEHKFYTHYAQKNFEPQKMENLVKIQKKLRKKKKKIRKNEFQKKKFILDQEKVEAKKDTSVKVERGVETMFRNVMRTHVEFSSLADNKANIMISVNTLLLTAIIAVLARKLDSNPHLIIPTAILTAVSLITLIYATLVTRPKITEGTFTKEDIEKKKANLLFFGNFHKMTLEDFTWGMKELISDRDYLYGSMINDFYSLGKVLGQKYRYLRICYTIFMYGLIIAVIAFSIAIFLYPDSTNLGPIIE